jgi:uncharacterized protein (DUF2384 family)
MNKNKELMNVLTKHQDIYKSLMELFNKHEESCLSWLNKPSKPLCNIKPIVLLSTEPDKVRYIIYQIETGDMS